MCPSPGKPPGLFLFVVVFFSSVLSEETPSFEFASPLYEVSLAEGPYKASPDPHEVLHVTLIPPKQEVRYEIMSLVDSRSQDMFKIDPSDGVITVTQDLDREYMDSHYLKVLASREQQTATATVHIRVTDLNDNVPEFEKSDYKTTVHEVTPIGSSIITVRATDKDTGENGDISYTMVTEPSDDKLFSLDSTTGSITLRKLLDRELKSVHTITVFAKDNAPKASNRKQSNCTVQITVIDDNDNHPQFNQGKYIFQVAENINWKEKPLVGTITALDADQGNNAKLKYSIIGGNNERAFEIGSENGELKVVRELDREAKDEYTLIVRVQDLGSPPKSNTSQVVIQVKDVNDNSPRFPTTKYYQSVSENVPKDYAILQVQAFDPDIKANSEISYRLPNEYTAELPFHVEESTGWITAKQQIDREVSNSFFFPVVASDHGVPPLSSSVSVTITVLDANDNDPLFDQKDYKVSVKETVALGSTIVEVKATDDDKDTQLRYEIVAGNTRNRFTISSQHGVGVISLAQPLNFRDEANYVVIVNAIDQGGRFGTCTVEISVIDANDHAPKFENTPYFADIFEDTPVGSTVLMLFASDQDYADNAKISYRLKSDSKHFDVDSGTGALTVARPLDREEISTFILSVMAEDNGLPRLADETEVEISVLDVNDNPPKFTKSMFSADLRENAPVGTKVMRISAVDRDERDNGKVKFHFEKPSSDAFDIDEVSGDVRTSRALDREAIAQYELIVIASDNGFPENRARAKVIINILDVNDNPPVFENDTMIYYLNENSPYGTKIGDIVVRDPDIGENSEISFQLLNSSDSKYFYLGEFNQAGGISLFSKREFDFEKDRSEYFLGIRAESTPLRTDANIHVKLLDVNDNQPTLDDFYILHNLQGDEYMFDNLGKVPAFDADPTSNLTYNITYGNNANFLNIDFFTGEIKLSPTLSSNVNIRAQLGLVVSDGQNEARSTLYLQINHVTEPMLKNSVTVRFANVTEEEFLSPFLSYFEEALTMAVSCTKEEIVVFGIKSGEMGDSAVNVTFSIAQGETNSDMFVEPSHIKQRIYLHQKVIEKIMGLSLLDFMDDICVREPCLNYERCVTEPKFGKEHNNLAFRSVKFRSIDTLLTYACFCPNGFTGMATRYTCDTEVNLCYSNPCQNGATCISSESDFTCQCPEQFGGERCQIDLSVSDCSQEMCEAPAKCRADGESWTCDNCSDNEFNDRFCRLTSRSFSPQTYVAYPTLPQRVDLNISLEFATQNPSGLIFYNGRLNDEDDYISLSLVNSHLLLEYSTGEDSYSLWLKGENGFSDGNFHRVQIDYHEQNVTMSTGMSCDIKLALLPDFKNLLPASYRCANSTTLSVSDKKSCGTFLNQCSKFLDLTGPFLLGGFPRNRRHPSGKTESLVGCVRNVYVNHEMLNMNQAVYNNGSLSGCPEKRNFCVSSPCQNSATCENGWGSYRCHCPQGWTGKDCGSKSQKIFGLKKDTTLSFRKKLVPIKFPWISEISFKTSLRSTTLLTVLFEDTDVVSQILIRNGVVTYKTADSQFELESSFVSDGHWHNIVVKWMAKEVWLNLDYGQHERTFAEFSPLSAKMVTKIVIGGGGGNDGGDKFEGCVQVMKTEKNGRKEGHFVFPLALIIPFHCTFMVYLTLRFFPEIFLLPFVCQIKA